MMFLHVFRYRLLTLFRVKWCIGWNIAFPLVLATAFFLGFGNMIKDDPDAFSTVPVALVTESGRGSEFGKIVEECSKNSKDQLFELTVSDKKDSAVQLLKDKKVDGVYIDGEDPVLIVRENGMEQTILSEFLSEYKNSVNTMQNVIKTDPSKAGEASEMLSKDMELLKEKTFNGNSNASPYLKQQAREALNWTSTFVLGSIACTILTLIFIGGPLQILLGVAHLVFCLMGANAARSGNAFRVPMTWRPLQD